MSDIQLIVLGMIAFTMMSVYVSYTLAKKRVNELGDFVLNHVDNDDEPRLNNYVNNLDYGSDLLHTQRTIDKLSKRIDEVR